MAQLRSLGQPNSRFAGDDGAPDPLTREAMGKANNHTGYIRAIVALCTSRLLMPIVATGDEAMDGPHPDRHAEMAAVTLRDESGSYLLAFTGIDSLKLWSPEARPVPCLLDELCATVAAAGAGQLLIDIAGPTPFVIAGEALTQLAEGNRLVEFEGEDFAWVTYADTTAAEPLGGGVPLSTIPGSMPK